MIWNGVSQKKKFTVERIRLFTKRLLLHNSVYEKQKAFVLGKQCRVVGQMKRWVSKIAGFSVWQKSFYEHIIRDERDYVMHLLYMEQNPAKKIYND